MTDTLVMKRGLVLPSVLSSFTVHVFVKHVSRPPPPKKNPKQTHLANVDSWLVFWLS